MKKTLLLSISSGFILIFSFAPFSAGFLAYFAFVPLFFALEGATAKKGFLPGWCGGFIFFLGTVYWVVHSMYFYGGVGLAAGIAVMVLLAAYLALYTAAFSSVIARNMPSGKGGFKNGVVFILFASSLWVTVEYLRSVLFTGFPWVLLGYSQAGYLPLIQIADIAGIWGISFMVMAINASAYLVVKAVKGGDRTGVYRYGAVLAGLFLIVAVYGEWKIKKMDEAVSAWNPLKVAVAQGNIEQSLKWEEAYKLDTFEIYRDLSASSAGARLIVWPESAMPFYLAHDKALSPLVAEVPKRQNAYLLTGAPHYEYNSRGGGFDLFNSAFLLSPAGEFLGRYDKTHLVPFGEYVPLRNILFFIKKLTVGVGDFKSGSAAVPLRFDGASVAVLICYEAIFPEITAAFARRGANLIVNITNDAWFGVTSAPYQHFDMSRLRAVENRLYLVRAANTGISAIVDPAGRVVTETGLFRRALMTGEVRVKPFGITFFAGYGRFFPFLAMLFSVVVILGRLIKK